MWSAIILNYFCGEELKVYYQEARESLGDMQGHEIVAVDNGSPLYGPVLYEETNYVVCAKNHGFAKGMNIGVAASMGDYVLFMNNDARITSGDWKKELSTILDDHSVGCVIPHLKNAGEPDYQPQLVGCVFAMRRDVARKFGPFLEAFERGYYEDTDLFKRLLDAGLKVVDCPNVKVDHRGQSTFKSSMKDEEILAISARNKEIYDDLHRGQYPTFSPRT